MIESLLGNEIKGYELRELIGTGGFGAVYRAYQPIIGREVAVKVILPEYANAPTFIRRFETEAQLVARLEHPYIVPLYDYWRDPKGAYLVMRYLRGGSLTQLIRQNGPLSFERAGVMLNQIASALAVAHNDGVIHRDLKPDNILLDEAGNHYLSDFGIAKDIGRNNVNLTQTGTIIGSPAYLSPEQITGEDVTALSDVYSLGILLHYALTGEHPFPGKTPTAMMIHQLHDPVPLLQSRRDDVTDHIEEVLQRTTAKDPSMRYISVMELALAYNRALRESNASTSQIQRLMTTDGGLLMTGMAPHEIKNPYKGLKAFEEADNGDFFGREQLTERLVERLTPRGQDGVGERLLVIVGPSGSGKSSVVKAGLIPALRHGAIVGNDVIASSQDWFYTEMVPGAHPMEEMEAALLRIAVNPPESLLHQLQEDERGLVRAVKRVLPDDNSQLVILIDQFEEVFTLTEDNATRQHFLNSLMKAANEDRSRLRLILTLRADFYDRPLSYYEFGEMVRVHTEVVLPLGARELENAIILPARQIGVTLEAGLATAIADDVREQPGALPLLQYALTQLFERRDGSRLTLAAYDEIGGAMGALARRAEQIYQELNEVEQIAAQQMFLRLVTLGEGQEDTRRRILRTELHNLGDNVAMERVIATLGKQRLLTFDNDPQTREPTLEVAHEALIREWNRLRDWLDAAREDLRTQRRLNHATSEWLAQNRDDSFLASGSRLEQFAGLRDTPFVAMNQQEAAYVAESLNRKEAAVLAERERIAREEALEERAQQRMRWVLMVVSVAAVVATALAVLSGILFQRAQVQRALAEDNAQLAAINAQEAQERASESSALALAASSLNLIDEFLPTDALKLALEANRQQSELTPVKQALAEAAYAPGEIAQLNPLADASLLSLAFNGDGTQAIAGSATGKLLIIDPLTNTIIDEIDAHVQINNDNRGVGTPVYAVAASPTAAIAASSSTNGVIRLWDTAQGEVVRELEGHTAQVNQMAFSPDGSLLLSGADANGELFLWDVETGRIRQRLAGNGGRVLSVDFSGDGQRVIAAMVEPPDAGDASLRIAFVYEVASGDQIATLRAENTGWLRAAALSPDGTRAAIASYDPNEFGGTIRLWDVDSGQIIRRLLGHTDVITTVDYAPDGRTLLSGGWDQTVRHWDINTGAQVQRFDTHVDRVLDVVFSPDGAHALSSSGNDGDIFSDNSAFLIALERRDLIHNLEGHSNWLWTAVYSPDGSAIATGSGKLNVTDGDNTVRLWDAETGAPLAVFEGHTDTVSGADFSPDGALLATSSYDDTVIIWDAATGDVLRRLTGHEGDVNSVNFSPDGTLLVTGSSDDSIRLWDVQTGKEQRVIESAHEGRTFRVKFSPDGTKLVSGGSDSLVVIWDIATGENLHSMSGHTGWVNAVNFSQDGQFVVSGADDDVIMWDVATGTEVRRFVGHEGFVYGATLSPDDRYLISGGSDTSVRLWETDTGEEIRRFDGHTNWVLDVVFSPDGTQAVSAAEDNTAKVWRIARSSEELVAWATANRYVTELTCVERERYSIEPLCDSLSRPDSEDS